MLPWVETTYGTDPAIGGIGGEAILLPSIPLEGRGSAAPGTTGGSGGAGGTHPSFATHLLTASRYDASFTIPAPGGAEPPQYGPNLPPRITGNPEIDGEIALEVPEAAVWYPQWGCPDVCFAVARVLAKHSAAFLERVRWALENGGHVPTALRELRNWEDEVAKFRPAQEPVGTMAGNRIEPGEVVGYRIVGEELELVSVARQRQGEDEDPEHLIGPG